MLRHTPHGLKVGAIIVLGLAPGIGAAEPVHSASFHRVYATLMNPREHPDDGRRHVKPPDWDAVGNRTRFTVLRGFGMENNRIVGYREEIDKYVNMHELGDVLWPAYTILPGENLGEVLDEIKRRDLFLFDLWGYVPGSGPGDYCQQFKVPRETLDLLESKLGARWLGMDIGEQDGRYIGGYAPQMQPASADRFEQYLNFHRHFERMCDDMGNRVTTLVSLNFGHYKVKEGLYTSIGAETAQALPNGQVYYSFIRGAGKQYGVPWFGNASVFNRWGWKVYGPAAADHSPTKGTSLSLLKRLIYSHILYNSIFVGFESGWFEGDKLSPIGHIQQAAQKWIKANGQPGVMITPIGLLVDFNAGWSYPRHLYTDRVYRVWGNLPYEPGDYLTDSVLDMIYPGYQDSSYYHDESGFLTPTPYGDSADCLLSDAEQWLLDRYPLLVVAGALAGGEEIRDKLHSYVDAGGHLIITAGSLKQLPDGIAGIEVAGPSVRHPAGSRIEGSEKDLIEDQPFVLYPMRMPAGAQTRLRCSDSPVVVEATVGKGRITVLASPFGIGAEAAAAPAIRNEVDQPLPKPFTLLKHTRAVLDEAFRGQRLFEAGEGLSLITCRKEAGRYILGICNNGWSEKPMKIVSHCGPIASLRELTLDQSEKTAVGFMPEGMEKVRVGTSGPETIAGGDVRVFDVRVREVNVETIAHAAPPPRARGRILHLRNTRSIKEEVLARPTFFERFDSVLVDWAYLRRTEKAELQREAGWIQRQGLKVLVDLSPGINLFPDLRLVDNVKEEYTATIATVEDILAKMELVGARDLLISLHRHPENNYTNAQTETDFGKSVKRICEAARTRQITVHLRMTPHKPPWNLKAAVDFVTSIGVENLRVAPSTAMLLANPAELKPLSRLLPDKLGFWLVAAPETDIAGQLWNVNGPIADCKRSSDLAAMFNIAPNRPVIFDAVYRDGDGEYRDARTWQRIIAASTANRP